MVRAVARPMLASWFVAEGVQVLRHPEEHATAAEGALRTVQRFSSSVRMPEHERMTRIVRMHGAAVALAGAALATGRMPRLAGLTLAGLTLPLAAVDHPFVPGLSAQERTRRRDRCLQALAMTGGALLAAADTAGRPGIGWRIKHARKSRASD